MNMNSRTLSEDEVIRRIELLGGIYNPDSDLSLFDQLEVCESLSESTLVNPDDSDGKKILNIKKRTEGWNGSVMRWNGSVMRWNGSCQHNVNTWLTQSKRNAITQLNQCNYRSNPKVVAGFLEEIFSDYPSKPGYWFSIAQNWPPRRINQVMNYLRKLENPGHITVRNPAAYFSYLINHRERRKHPK
jgi:hypothetical protein